jgi:MoxR-like ATPase
MTVEKTAEEFGKDFQRLEDEIGRVIVGQRDVIQNALACFFAGGHVLLEGVPGLGKTMLVKSMAQACELQFSRIQFTPDLMPADILGTDVVLEDEHGGRKFEFRRGPIHSQIVLADEINRATPKTQSAMLEAMQEGQVSAGNSTYILDQPFFVMATQNPIEMEGTYPLPEAQLDRFMFKVKVTMANKDELKEVLSRTTDGARVEPEKVIDTDTAKRYREFIPQLLTADNVKDYVVRIILATHPDSPYATDLAKKYVRYGSSPRGAQALATGSKVYAAIDGRLQVGFEDVRRAAFPGLRHRILLNFEGEAEGISTDAIITQILESLPEVDGGSPPLAT